METQAYRLADNLFLVWEPTPASTQVFKKPNAINHLFVCDCSGSMSGDLPRIREQIKNKVATYLQPGDTLSVIWFSGKGEFGTLLSCFSVDELRDLPHVARAIDKLRPIGLTGFKEPIEEVERLIETTRSKNKSPWSMTFLSDGCDNQWFPREQILKAIDALPRQLASASIVEYGYYADRAFLAKMAERAGGTHVFAEDFDRFEPQFRTVLEKRNVSSTIVELPIRGTLIGEFGWTVSKDPNEISTFAVNDLDGSYAGTFNVPEQAEGVFYLASKVAAGVTAVQHSDKPFPAQNGLYSALALYSLRGKPEIVFPILQLLGDVAFIDMFANCFGKQKYTEFYQLATEATFDPSKRLMAGYNPSRVPAEDAFTVLDFLKLLASDDHNRVLLDSKDFKYSRIGRRREANEDALKFTPDAFTGAAGYSVSNLTFKEDRPNVSILVKKTGTVDLKLESIPATSTVPFTFPTHIFRNYAILQDGLVNVDKLPCLLTSEVMDKLAVHGVVPDPNNPKLSVEDAAAQKTIDGKMVWEATIDLKKLPIINRKMVKNLSAKEFFTLHYELMKARAAQKAFGYYYKELVTSKSGVTRTSEGMEQKYGKEVAAWLKERGLTDNGFSPRTAVAKVSDFYMGKELKVSLKGLSSLPDVKEAIEKLTKAADEKAKKGDKAKPAPIGSRLMAPYLAEVDAFLKANKGRDKVIAAWLDGQQIVHRTNARRLMAEASQCMIIVIVGQTWFKEFATLDENTLTIDTPDGPIICTVEMKEIEVKI